MEVTGSEQEVDTFLGLVRNYGIKELVRTGAVVMSRGSSSIERRSKRDPDGVAELRLRPRSVSRST